MKLVKNVDLNALCNGAYFTLMALWVTLFAMTYEMYVFLIDEYWLKMSMKNVRSIYGGLKVVFSMNSSRGWYSYIAQV